MFYYEKDGNYFSSTTEIVDLTTITKEEYDAQVEALIKQQEEEYEAMQKLLKEESADGNSETETA